MGPGTSEADSWAAITLFFPAAWHSADLWFICTFSGYGRTGERNPQIDVLLLICNFCRVREAHERSCTTVYGVGLLFPPLLTSHCLISFPLARHDGNWSALQTCPKQRQMVALSGQFCISGEPSESSVRERTERWCVCACVNPGASEACSFFLNLGELASFPPSISGKSEPPLCA